MKTAVLTAHETTAGVLITMTIQKRILVGGVLVLAWGSAGLEGWRYLASRRVEEVSLAHLSLLQAQLTSVRSQVLSVQPRLGDQTKSTAQVTAPSAGIMPTYKSPFPPADDLKEAEKRNYLFEAKLGETKSEMRGIFSELGLSDDTLERYAALVLHQFAARNFAPDADFQTAADASGMHVADYRRKVYNDFDSDARALLGSATYDEVLRLKNTRDAIVDLANYASNWGADLTPNQARDLSRLIRSNYAIIQGNHGIIPVDLIEKSQGVLTQNQVMAWRRLQILSQAEPDMLQSLEKLGLTENELRSTPVSAAH